MYAHARTRPRWWCGGGDDGGGDGGYGNKMRKNV